MKAPWSYLPALPATVGVVSGIILSHLGVPVLAVGVPICAFAALYLARQHYMAFIMLFVAVGQILAFAHKPNQVSVEPHILDIVGRVGAVDEGQESTSCILTIDSICHVHTPPIKCRLTVLTASRIVEPGATIEVTGKLHDITDTPIVPHEVDYNKYLSAEGITCRALVRPDAVKLIEAPNGMQRIINRMRDALYNGIVCAPITSDTASFLLAALLGNDTLLPDTLYDDFRAIGIAHVLALSGLHVGIIVFFFAILLFAMRMYRPTQVIRSIVLVAIVWTYAVIVGMSPSIVRASVMFTVYVCASHIQNGHQPFNSLLLSIIVILCINPFWLFTPGFQLSVSAVATLLLVGALIPERIYRHRALSWALMLVVVPIAAMVGTGIIGIYYFNTFPALFLIANIFAGLIFPWLLSLGLILMLSTAMGCDFTLLGAAVDGLYHLLSTGIADLSAMGWGRIEGISISAWVLLPYFVALFTLIGAISYRSRWMLTAAAVLACATALTAYLTRERIPSVELYMPNTAQVTDIVIHANAQAWLYTDSPEPDNELERANALYDGFLKSRHCQNFRLIDSLTQVHIGTLDIDYPYIKLPGCCICIIDTVMHRPSAATGIDYAVVSRHYRGSAKEIVDSLRPDTIVLPAGIHPSRRKRLIRECADTIVYGTRISSKKADN